MKNLHKDKVVLVTGGASGIGRELALKLAAAEARVAVVDISQPTIDQLDSDMRKLGLTADTHLADMSIAGEAENIFNVVIEKYKQLDYVINSAGIFAGGEIRDTPIDDWHKVLQNNIFAISNGSHYAYQIMVKQGHGHIVNIGSTAGLIPIPAMGIYGASKYAIVGLTNALRNEARDLGVRVSVVCPTIVDTPLYDTAIYNSIKVGKMLDRRQSFQSAEVAAERILRGMKNNKATIHTAWTTHAMWLLYRALPGLYDFAAVRIMRRYRQKLRRQ